MLRDLPGGGGSVRRASALLACVCHLLVACTSSDDEPEPPSSPAPIAVVVIGSSTAAGYGLDDPALGWVARYAEYLAVERPGSLVTNLAVSATTTFHGLPTGTDNPQGRPRVDPAHNVSAALALAPDAIIVNYPSNDAAFSYPSAETLANLHTVADVAAQAGVTAWICTSQPRRLGSAGVTLLTDVRDAVLADFGERALDFWTPLAAADGTPLPEFNQGDGIHPNADGAELLFEVVQRADVPGHSID